MSRNPSPRTLHTELDQKRTEGKRGERRGKRPEIRDRNGQQRRDHYRAPAPELLTPDTESPAAQDRADVVDDGDMTRRMRVEAVLIVEESWVDVLGSVAEEI